MLSFDKMNWDVSTSICMAVGQISVFDVASMLGTMIILGDKYGSYTIHLKWDSQMFGAITMGEFFVDHSNLHVRHNGNSHCIDFSFCTRHGNWIRNKGWEVQCFSHIKKMLSKHMAIMRLCGRVCVTTYHWPLAILNCQSSVDSSLWNPLTPQKRLVVITSPMMLHHFVPGGHLL